MSTFTPARLSLGALIAMQATNALGEAIPLQEVLESFEKTQLPRTLLPFLVVTKLLSIAALALPVPRWLKEWAFAGILIDVLGAGASYLLANELGAFGLKMVPLALLVWAFAYVQFRREAGSMPAPARAAVWVDRVLAVIMLGAATGELLRVPDVVTSLKVIGYPVQILTILVPAKTLAAMALLIPGFPTLRTWARAGLSFNFAGALYSYSAVGVALLPDVPLLIALSGLVIAGTGLTERQTKPALA